MNGIMKNAICQALAVISPVEKQKTRVKRLPLTREPMDNMAVLSVLIDNSAHALMGLKVHRSDP